VADKFEKTVLFPYARKPAKLALIITGTVQYTVGLN